MHARERVSGRKLSIPGRFLLSFSFSASILVSSPVFVIIVVPSWLCAFVGVLPCVHHYLCVYTFALAGVNGRRFVSSIDQWGKRAFVRRWVFCVQCVCMLPSRNIPDPFSYCSTTAD